MPTLSAAVLQSFTESRFQAAGVEAGNARIVADSLVDANLRGHDSHGVMRVPFYIGSLKNGKLDPKAK
ncbi:MAG TPA: Ldh family oxidoreductase, partial [Planctomycetaceae bacterium]|nr:Ldh family oxidoreductase [Planctomycetaceae bacterium]